MDKRGVAIKLVFKLTQHSDDEDLMGSIKSYFYCGNISKYKIACDYKVIKLRDVLSRSLRDTDEKIIPFFLIILF